MTALLQSLEPLVATLRTEGYVVVGPQERDGAIVLDVIESAAALPSGWGIESGPGTYRIHRRADRAAFAHSAGPQAWKRYLHPPRELLYSAHRGSSEDLTFDDTAEPPERYAFLGVRACDLRAIAVQDRVLGSSARYRARRRATLLIGVNCTEPSATCFCVSAGGGPDAQTSGIDADIVLTELIDADEVEPRYVASAGTETGRRLLATLPQSPVPEDVASAAQNAVAAAADRMQRSLPDVDLPQMLARTLDSPRWDEVASRCLTCANCTMVCPTCFCTSVSDTTDLTGEQAQRWQRWASCFEIDFSYLHGGSVRTSAHSRYRQWLTHKLGTWHDQFGESGCVGCGRCIAWCPAGIDITAEAHALAREGTQP